MQDINEFIKENPKMRLKEIAKMYCVSMSKISKLKKQLGIKRAPTDLSKKIESMLHLSDKRISNELGCSIVYVSMQRIKTSKIAINRRIDLNDYQKELVRLNYNSMTNGKLAELIGVTTHVLRNRMAEMKLYNDMERESTFYDYDLDNGNGFFDLEKYKKVML